MMIMLTLLRYSIEISRAYGMTVYQAFKLVRKAITTHQIYDSLFDAVAIDMNYNRRGVK